MDVRVDYSRYSSECNDVHNVLISMSPVHYNYFSPTDRNNELYAVVYLGLLLLLL